MSYNINNKQPYQTFISLCLVETKKFLYPKAPKYTNFNKIKLSTGSYLREHQIYIYSKDSINNINYYSEQKMPRTSKKYCSKTKRHYCSLWDSLQEYCKESIDKLQEIENQINNFCREQLNVGPLNIIVQQTDQSLSQIISHITSINERRQWNQQPYYIRNNQSQLEIEVAYQGQNQIIAQSQIDEIKKSFQRTIDQNQKIHRQEFDALKQEIDQLQEKTSEYEVREEIRNKKEKQELMFQDIKEQFNKAIEYTKNNHQNIWDNELINIFYQLNGEIVKIFSEYDKFEEHIKKKDNLIKEIRLWHKNCQELEFEIVKLKNQNDDSLDKLKKKEESLKELQKKIEEFQIMLDQTGKKSQEIQLNSINKDHQLNEKTQQINILQEQFKKSQEEFENKQNEIKTFFESIVSKINLLLEKSPLQQQG